MDSLVDNANLITEYLKPGSLILARHRITELKQINMKRFVFALFFLTTVFSCQGQHGNGASSSGGSSTVLTANEFKTKIAQKGVQLVDVRTAREFASGHISGAKNIDAMAPGFENQAGSQLDKNQPVAVYCRSGVRSARAAGTLRRMGFKTVYDLKGGYLAWMAQ